MMNQKGFKEDKRYKQANKEALIAIALKNVREVMF